MDVSLRDFKASDYKDMKRKSETDGAGTAYLNKKLAEILSHPGVNHPFLKRYAREGLPQGSVAEKYLYLETYYYFHDVPFYICSMCTITRDEDILREIVRNVSDEMGETRSHSELFLDFLNSIGIDSEQISSHTCLPSTEELNQGTLRMYTKSTITKALGSFFAEETQSAAMVNYYNSGLLHSGYSKEQRSFWEMHAEAELGHSNSAFNCIHPYIQSDADKAVFESGILGYMTMMKKFWDGVEGLVSGNL